MRHIYLTRHSNLIEGVLYHRDKKISDAAYAASGDGQVSQAHDRPTPIKRPRPAPHLFLFLPNPLNVKPPSESSESFSSWNVVAFLAGAFFAVAAAAEAFFATGTCFFAAMDL